MLFTRLAAFVSASTRFGDPSMLSSTRSLPVDFTDPAVAPDWIAVDDRVMGGASQSRVVFAGGETSFEGTLIVEGGGFASARLGPDLQLQPGVEVLVLEASSDGRLGYKLTLTSAATPSGVSYQFTLPRLGDERQRVTMPLDQFKPSYRGRAVPDAPPLRASDVRGMGLMLSRYEEGGGTGKQPIAPGDFWLRLRRLEATESELALNGSFLF
jgi:NADH dehydrogenase [ubiquinone] 1 alpha subcomplex assembly factor 1